MPINTVIFITSPPPPRRGCEVLCLSVCLFVCFSISLSARISQKQHGRTSPKMFVHFANALWSFSWRRCDTLCIYFRLCGCRPVFTQLAVRYVSLSGKSVCNSRTSALIPTKFCSAIKMNKYTHRGLRTRAKSAIDDCLVSFMHLFWNSLRL